MKPLEQFNRHVPTKMSFRKDVILDLLSRCPRSTISDLLFGCDQLDLGSQATIHRELHEMVKSKFINLTVSKQDRRIAFLKVSAAGKRYLEKL